MITPVYYQVGNEVYYNSILAKFTSYSSKQQLSFYCNDAEYDKLDWNQDLPESIDQLMDSYARKIRQTYNYVVLLYSGGTDSRTIYDVFVRNNLHIDEIVVWADDQFEPYFSSLAYTDLLAKHQDPTTLIRCKNRFDIDEFKSNIKNENWILENKSMIVKSGANMYDSIVRDCKDKCKGTWCVLNGHEQPNVYIKDNYFYSCFPAIRFHSTMGFENVIPFFIEPTLAHKQAHLIKNIYTKLMSVNKYSTADSERYYQYYGVGVLDGRPIHFRYAGPMAYTAWQRAIGRTGDLYYGYSSSQKKEESKFDSYQNINLQTVDSKSLAADVDLGLAALLSKNDDTAQLFQRGIRNILLEQDFCNEVLENSLTPNILGKRGGKPVYSKSYCLGKVVL